jgi:hypothetical protein
MRDPLFGDLEHGLAEVEAGDFGAFRREGESDVAGAATDVQSALTGDGCGPVDQLAFPPAVKAETLEVVDEIVTRRDFREQILDLGGAACAFLIELVRHVRASLEVDVQSAKLNCRRPELPSIAFRYLP